MQNINPTGIESNVSRLVEESLNALTEVDQRIQAIRAGLVQAIPALSHQMGAPGFPQIGQPQQPFQGQIGAFSPLQGALLAQQLARQAAIQTQLPFAPFAQNPLASFATQPQVTFVPTPYGIVPVPVAAIPGIQTPWQSPTQNFASPINPFITSASFQGISPYQGFTTPMMGNFVQNPLAQAYGNTPFGQVPMVGPSFRSGLY